MKKIALLLTISLLVLMQVVSAQNRTVTGKVTYAEDGTSLPGVSIVVKGTSIGAISDVDGNYSITAPSDAETLVFTFVGMEKKEVAITGNVINVSLSSSQLDVEEVIVVAYGTSTKESFTGSAAAISSEKLARKNTSEITKALAGEVAGVQVINSSGQPGSVADIRIRGLGSINASKEPLYIVDGVPYNGTLSAIDPSDIESTTILKDASATAIYGSRGANGVILITTKKGIKGTSKIEVDVKYGVNTRLIPLYDVIDSPENFVALTWEGLRNRYQATEEENPAQLASENLFSSNGISEYYNMWNADDNALIDEATGQFKDGIARKYTPGSWSDAIFHNGKRQEVNVKMSGGADKTSYYTSYSILQDEGYYIKSDFTRFSTRANVDHQVKPWLKGNMNIAYSYTEMNSPGQTDIANNGFYFVNNMPPIFPVYVHDADGNIMQDELIGGNMFDYGFDRGTGSRAFGGNINPAGAVQLDEDQTKRHQLAANTNLEVKFTDNLTLSSTMGVQYLSSNNADLTNPYYGDAQGLGRIYKNQHNYMSYTMNQILRFKDSFGASNLEAFIAHESTLYQDQYMYGQKSKIARPDNMEWTNAVILDYMQSWTNDYSLESYFGQVKYDFDEKYFLYGTLRRDGSSRFDENKWGTFGAVGAAWMVSKESFFNVNFIEDLKVKASYGIIGNQEFIDANDASFGFYPTYDTYTISNLNDELSFSFYRKGNPNLTWESSKTFNTGIEFSLGSFLEAEVEYFVKNTDNLLFMKQVAPSLGFSEYPVNDGALQNSGIEFNFIAHVVNSGDFKLDINVNGGNYKNKITRMPIDETTGLEKNMEIHGAYNYMVGHSVYDFYVREYAGADTETGVPTWNRYYDEVNGEKIYILDMEVYKAENTITALGMESTTSYNEATKKFVDKSVIPTLSGGFGLDFSYKGLELSTQLAYSFGGYSYDNIYAVLMGNHTPGENNWSKDIENRWQNPGDVTDVPRLSSDYDKQGNSLSTRFITSNSYLNLSNVRLSYTLPSSVSKKVKMEKTSVWVAGDNLFLMSARQGFIPVGSESGSSNRARYAPLSTISVGVKLEF